MPKLLFFHHKGAKSGNGNLTDLELANFTPVNVV